MRICKHRIKYSYIYCKKMQKLQILCTMYNVQYNLNMHCWKTIMLEDNYHKEYENNGTC